MKKTVATNKKAYHDYKIIETLEAGLVLTGTEVKSLRAGKVNLRDSYGKIKDSEVFLFIIHISPYEKGTVANHEPKRTRKLLLHKAEIRRLIGKTKEKGYTLIPLSIYFVNNKAKVELALAQGKLLYDKRKALAEKEAKREVERAFKLRQRK
jgi:SsrA-binding protein